MHAVNDLKGVTNPVGELWMKYLTFFTAHIVLASAFKIVSREDEYLNWM